MSGKGKLEIKIRRVGKNCVLKHTGIFGNQITFLSPGTKPVFGYTKQFDFDNKKYNYSIHFKNKYSEDITINGFIETRIAGDSAYNGPYASFYRDSVKAYANDEKNMHSDDHFFRNKISVLNDLGSKQWWNNYNPILDYEKNETELLEEERNQSLEIYYKVGPIVSEVEKCIKEDLSNYSYHELEQLASDDENIIKVYKKIKRNILKMGVQVNELNFTKVRTNNNSKDLNISLKDVYGIKYGYGLTDNIEIPELIDEENDNGFEYEKILKKEFEIVNKNDKDIISINKNASYKNNDLYEEILNLSSEDEINRSSKNRDNKTEEELFAGNFEEISDEEITEQSAEKEITEQTVEKETDINKEETVSDDNKVDEEITEQSVEEDADINKEETVSEQNKTEEVVEETANGETIEENKVEEIQIDKALSDNTLKTEIINEDDIVEELLENHEFTDKELEEIDNADIRQREENIRNVFNDTEKKPVKNNYREIFAVASRIESNFKDQIVELKKDNKILKRINNSLNKENEELNDIISLPKFITFNRLQRQIDKRDDVIIKLEDDRTDLIAKKNYYKTEFKKQLEENEINNESLINYALNEQELNDAISLKDEEIADLNDQIKEYKEKNDSLFKEKEETNTKISNILGQVKELEKLTSDQNARISSLNNEHDEIIKESESLKDQINKYKDNYNILLATMDNKESDGYSEIIKEKDEEIDSLKSENEEYLKEINELKLSLDNKDREINRTNMVYDEKIKNSNLLIKEKESEIETNMNTIDALTSQINSIKEESELKDKDIDSLAKENKEKDKLIAALKAEIESLKNEEKNKKTIKNLKVYECSIDRIVLIEVDGNKKKYHVSFDCKLNYNSDYDKDLIINKLVSDEIKKSLSTSSNAINNFKVLNYDFKYDKSVLVKNTSNITKEKVYKKETLN